MGGRGNNQFFRHENSSLCAAPAKPEPPFCVVPDMPGSSLYVVPTGMEPPDDIAVSVCSTGVRTNSLPRAKRGYVGDTFVEMMPERTKPEGWIPDAPGSVMVLHFLLLARPVRCREGQTADDAVLTLIIPNFQTGAALGKVRRCARHWRIAQLTNRRIRTFITRPIARKTNNVAEPP